MKYKIGDKVKTPFGTGEVIAIQEGGYPYEVKGSFGSVWFPESDLTLVKKDLTNLEVGDVVEKGYGKRMVLGVCGRVYLMSGMDDFEICIDNCTAKELEKAGYKLVSESKEDTINLLGKTYKKSDIENALKGIEEVSGTMTFTMN